MKDIKVYELHISKIVGNNEVKLFGRNVEANNVEQAIKACRLLYNEKLYPRTEWKLELVVGENKILI